MRKEFTDYEEMVDFVEDLLSQAKWVVTPRELAGGTYAVEWMDHKTYVSQDGKEYPDEVWVTESHQVLLVQDMCEEHAKNALRMMLRNERTRANLIEKLVGSLVGDEIDHDSGEGFTGADTDDEADNETVRNLRELFSDPSSPDSSSHDHIDMQIPTTAVKGPSTLQ